MSEPAIQVTVSKLDVARRQLDTALDLWFRNADPISIHTLACASHEVFSFICGHRGLSRLILDPAFYAGMNFGKTWYQIERHYNFFKHAKKDPDATIKFPPILSELFMFMSIEGWLTLGGEPTELDDAFVLHMMLQCPEAHRTDTQERIAKSLAVKALAKFTTFQNRQEFLRFFRIGRTNRKNAKYA